ncbi:hypothetical protein SAMN05421644_13116 [Allochromatium warmingii]|uniref:Uncharacterized protein n=1 Tax=Allochromatium warmingii TaxID=61595 RepID=A0A1H3H8Y5_ALLWA|nr:DUF5682 family protein [Allochromatium warmingii]SDY12043.1 hypothetical protein SAMN05421644_13116 [Allochromatium warmingii]
MPNSPFHLFGIRHHGPGCARSLRHALDALNPDCILVEGPPEGQALLDWLGDSELVPPVALLVYDPKATRDAVFYPFAEFSPEWQALRFGSERGVPTRFFDLPVANRLTQDSSGTSQPDALEPDADNAPQHTDPLDWLGRAAGYSDGESWWNHLVEERGDGLDLFAAIREAMTLVRAESDKTHWPASRREQEARREAHMRKQMRQARKDGFERIAVICGAWHVPALVELPSATADNALLKSLPKRTVEATWVPWSYPHLSTASGYGAGIDAPGWYEHLWQSPPSQRAIGWITRAAQVLRAEDLDCSSAHVIEAVRLAEALAALRERPQPSLDELDDAVRTVVCHGDSAPLRLIRQTLVIGERLGRIPEHTPVVPLQRDLAERQRALRLKPEAGHKTLDLDLRQPNDLARSQLLHRLALLGIHWGEMQRTSRAAKGTFHEIWTLRWEPQHALAVIDASRWGNSVEAAATRCLIVAAQDAETLPMLCELVERLLLADLQAAIGPVTRRLEDQAAIASDVPQMLGAIPPLAAILRYGNVRQTDSTLVAHVLAGLVPRAALALPGACTALDDAAAVAMRTALQDADRALHLLQNAEFEQVWSQALHQLAASANANGQALLGGLATRLLFDAQQADLDITARRLSLALSVAAEPTAAAAWLDGFLNHSALVLLHDPTLWALVDAWVAGLSDEHFMRVLPLVRRAFAAFAPHERQQLGERARRPLTAAAPVTLDTTLDLARAERPIPLLQRLLGIAPL